MGISPGAAWELCTGRFNAETPRQDIWPILTVDGVQATDRGACNSEYERPDTC